VEKGDPGRIGLYLCCGEEGNFPVRRFAAPNSAHISIVRQVSIDYQVDRFRRRWFRSADVLFSTAHGEAADERFGRLQFGGVSHRVCCSSHAGPTRRSPVCCRFGKEKAWGLGKFCTLEQLQKEGAYIASEDRVTFGCRMVPVKNLLWGAVARSATAAAPRGIFSTP
jgi:hypothetical protein